jgi:hypothetical protein
MYDTVVLALSFVIKKQNKATDDGLSQMVLVSSHDKKKGSIITSIDLIG